MNRLVLFIFFLMFSLSCGKTFGQSDISKLYLQKSLSTSDTAIINIHLEIAKLLTEQDPESAHLQIDTAYQLSIKYNYIKGQVNSLVTKSILANNHNQHSEAIEHLTKAITIASKLSGDKSTLGAIHHRQGHTYSKMSRYYESIQHFHLALDIFEELKDSLSIANTLTNIGIIHINLEEKESAIENYESAASLYRQIEHKEGLVYYYNNIGHINQEENKLEAALTNYSKGLELAKEADMTYMEGHIYGNLGLLYMDKNDNKSALDFLQKEREINESISNESKKLYSILAISKIKFDESKSVKYIDTINYCLNLAQQSGDLNLQENALMHLAEIHSELNNHKKAYTFLTQYNELKDSKSNNQLKRRINTLKINHEIQRVQREKESEIQNAKLIRNLALAAFLCLVLFSFIINKSYVTTKKIRTKLEIRNKQLLDADRALDKKNKDLEKYIDSNMQLKQFAHIASHDIKSPLRTILSFSSLLKRNLYDKVGFKEKGYFDSIEIGAKRITELVEDLLEYSTLNSQELSLSQFSIHALVNEVCDNLIFSINDKNAKINNPAYTSIITADRTKIKQVIQNLLDNAIKFSSTESDPIIDFSYEEDEQYHILSISDNGIGIDHKYSTEIFNEFVQLNRKDKFEGTGLGLSICKKYILKHKGQISVLPRSPRGSTFRFTINKNLT